MDKTEPTNSQVLTKRHERPLHTAVAGRSGFEIVPLSIICSATRRTTRAIANWLESTALVRQEADRGSPAKQGPRFYGFGTTGTYKIWVIRTALLKI